MIGTSSWMRGGNNISWPRKEVDFKFIGEGNIQVEITNSDKIEEEFFSYSNKFISSANLLAEHALSSNEIRKKDMWIFGIVYLYRQSIELLLKSIVFQYVTDKAKQKEFIEKARHDLRQAYHEVEKHIEEKEFAPNKDENEWLSKYLEDISYLDEHSDMFRYPFTTNMKAFFTKQIHINLKALVTNMNTAYQILLDIFRKIKRNIKIEYKPLFLLSDGVYEEQSVIWKGNNFYPYIEGYMDCANYLYNLIEDKKRYHLFLPMCYLYRNGIELALKRILVEDCQLDLKTAIKKLKGKHSIVRLWNAIKDHIKSRSSASDDQEVLVNVGIYIEQLHNIDSSSSRFRYPVDKNLNMHFAKKMKLDISNVSLCFNELFTFLDAVDGMLSHQNEILAEMAWEAQQSQDFDYDRY
ncbi:hypothetical protein [Domibacillus iocasae]|uniref:HEPN domain-containing protein n=1 Tax=Domibacillus iocasae TaxID=1714016 RepID=A0A1E7DQJ7_9BACI|nr:hypothetical protein [Domibacillus iocasae]OES45370.1 hypothetical protein BA724_05040 [Domibacillus iocasae]